MARLSVDIDIDFDALREELAKRDIVEVIRCKDCKLFDKEHEGGIGSCALDMNVAENDFCSKAVRKDEATP